MQRKKISSSQDRFPLFVWLEYGLFRLFETTLRILPLSAAYWVTELFVSSAFRLLPRFKRRAEENIKLAYGGQMSEADRRRLSGKYFRYISWFFVDMLLAPRLLKKQHFLDQVDCREALAALRYLDAGKNTGVLLVGSHQGAPDIIPLVLGLSGWPVTVVGRPLDNEKINRYVLSLRNDHQRSQLNKRGALRPALRILRENGIVGFQIDQDAGANGIFVPYFGSLASTHSGPATLAALTNVPCLMIHCIRTNPRQFAFKLFVELIEPPAVGLSRDEKIFDLTSRFTSSVEIMARRFPEQTLWGHRRWKTRPPKAVSDATRSEATRPLVKEYGQMN